MDPDNDSADFDEVLGSSDASDTDVHGKKAGRMSLEALLSDLDDDRRKVILDQVSKPRNEAKNLRERLKALEPKAAEYDRLAEASQTDMERLQGDLAVANQRAADAFTRAARAEVKAALAGVVDDPDLIVDDLNLAKFVTDDGDVDSDAIAQLRNRYSAFGKPRAPRPDASQGSSGNRQTANSPQEQFANFLKQSLAR